MVENLAFMLREHAYKAGRDIAIVHAERRVSYEELWNQVQSIMNCMVEQDIRVGDRVALLLSNSPEYVAAYYAILALGTIAVPLNIATKERDLTNWINHSGTKFLIADAAHPELSAILTSYVGKVLLSGDSLEKAGEQAWPSIDEISNSKIRHELGINNKAKGATPAAINYTSGTTGQPKGVTISHENLVSNTRSIIEYLRLSKVDSTVNVLPFYYSFGNSVLHTHIYIGGTLVLANSMMYPRHILQLIEKEKVTGFSGVPSTYTLLLNRSKMSDFDLTSLRYMTQAGGPMAPANILRLLELMPKVEFYVMYGQTEATARLSYLPPRMLQEKIGSVGIAIPGVELQIRDKRGMKVSEGEVGEIYAYGKNIMLGYWDDKKKTESAIENGWLKTGDLARYDKDGFLYIIGRSSEMIKTGAHRVSPKDIEEVLYELEGVEDAAVVGIPDEILGQAIKAYIVKRKESSLNGKQIKSYCKENLASYKIPKLVEFIDQIPKTGSGKVRRFLLQ